MQVIEYIDFKVHIEKLALRIYRYLFKEVITNFFAVTIVLLLIFVSGRFVKYLSEVAAGVITSKVLFSLILFRLSSLMELILPLALFLGIMLAYGRLYVESEMVVLQACGFSKRKFLFYTQGPALSVMVLVMLFSSYLSPLGSNKTEAIWNDPKTYSGLGTLVSGNFKRFESKGVVVYTAALNNEKTELNDVFIVRNAQEGSDKRLFLIKAQAAKVVSVGHKDPYIELYNGIEYAGDPRNLNFSTTRFSTYGQLINESDKDFVGESSVVGTPTKELFFLDSNEAKAALQWRIVMPFIVPIIALIALALSETNHRKGRYLKLLPGIIIYILYLALLIGVRIQIEKGKVSPYFSLWLVHIFFLCLGLFLLYMSEIKQRLAGFRRHKATDQYEDSSMNKVP